MQPTWGAACISCEKKNNETKNSENENNEKKTGSKGVFMEIIAVILFLLLLITMVQYVRYRRQIKSICRQMLFMENQETNKMVSTTCQKKEILELAERINDFIDLRKMQLQEYKRKDESLKHAITSLSHDIRTPLTALSGYFQLMQESADEEERARYAAVISGKISSLKNMLEELFTYAKLQNDNYQFDMQRENITGIVCENIFSFYEEFKEKGINPKIEIDEKEAYVICSSEAVGRIIRNIIKNALLHGRDKVEFVIRQEQESFLFVCRNHVERPEEIEIGQVFTRFYKADSARKNSSTGLGLAIAKELAERMNGKITAELLEDMFSVTVRFALCDYAAVKNNL